jgi:hypothetical protein
MLLLTFSSYIWKEIQIPIFEIHDPQSFLKENSKSLYEIHNVQCFFGNQTIKPNNTYLFMHDVQGFTSFVFLHWKTYCWIHDDLQSLTNLFGVTLKEFGVHRHSHKGVGALILLRWIYLFPYYDDHMCVGRAPKELGLGGHAELDLGLAGMTLKFWFYSQFWLAWDWDVEAYRYLWGRGGGGGEGWGNKEFFGLLKKDMCTFGTIVWFGEDTYVYSGFIFIKLPSCCWQRVCV